MPSGFGVGTDDAGFSPSIDCDTGQRERRRKRYELPCTDIRYLRRDRREPETFAHLGNLVSKVGRVERSPLFVDFVAEPFEVHIAADCGQKRRDRSQRSAERRFGYRAGLALGLHGAVDCARECTRDRHSRVEKLRFFEGYLFARTDARLNVALSALYFFVGRPRFGFGQYGLRREGLEELFEGRRRSKVARIGVAVQSLHFADTEPFEVFVALCAGLQLDDTRRAAERRERGRLDRLVFTAGDNHSLALPCDVFFDVPTPLAFEPSRVEGKVAACFKRFLYSLVDELGKSAFGLFDRCKLGRQGRAALAWQVKAGKLFFGLDNRGFADFERRSLYGRRYGHRFGFGYRRGLGRRRCRYGRLTDPQRRLYESTRRGFVAGLVGPTGGVHVLFEARHLFSSVLREKVFVGQLFFFDGFDRSRFGRNFFGGHYRRRCKLYLVECGFFGEHTRGRHVIGVGSHASFFGRHARRSRSRVPLRDGGALLFARSKRPPETPFDVGFDGVPVALRRFDVFAGESFELGGRPLGFFDTLALFFLEPALVGRLDSFAPLPVEREPEPDRLG